MKLQKLRHSVDDIGEDCIITHIVNQIDLGGEFTICGRAIPDADLELDGWEPVPNGAFYGTIEDCDCKNCKKTLYYLKHLQ